MEKCKLLETSCTYTTVMINRKEIILKSRKQNLKIYFFVYVDWTVFSLSKNLFVNLEVIINGSLKIYCKDYS